MLDSARMLATSAHCPLELLRPGGWCLADFVITKKLGTGGASAVYKAVLRGTSMPVAIKMYFKAKMTHLNVHQVHREVQIHQQLEHPNIISLVRICAACTLASFQAMLVGSDIGSQGHAEGRFHALPVRRWLQRMPSDSQRCMRALCKLAMLLDTY